MANYRIETLRHDIPRSVLHEFSAPDDEEALIFFQGEVNKHENSWNDLELLRVNVVEETERISGSENFRPEEKGRC